MLVTPINKIVDLKGREQGNVDGMELSVYDSRKKREELLSFGSFQEHFRTAAVEVMKFFDKFL